MLIPYAIITRGSPCVTPSLLHRKLAVPFPFRNTSDDQWRWQLNTKRALNVHKCLIFHITPSWLISLNAFFASTSKNSQFYVVKFLSQRSWTPWIAPPIPALSLAHSWSSWHAIVDYVPVKLITISAKRLRYILLLQLVVRRVVCLTRSGSYTKMHGRTPRAGSHWLTSPKHFHASM